MAIYLDTIFSCYNALISKCDFYTNSDLFAGGSRGRYICTKMLNPYIYGQIQNMVPKWGFEVPNFKHYIPLHILTVACRDIEGILKAFWQINNCRQDTIFLKSRTITSDTSPSLFFSTLTEPCTFTFNCTDLLFPSM